MFKYFESEKNKIISYMETFLKEKEKDLKMVNPLGPDSVKRILDFSGNGKMIRGGLVCLCYSLFSDSGDTEAVKAAAAMELFQSGFLIHDDIMDRDDLRRGKKSIYAQYQDLGKEKKARESYHLGESLGICSGDLAFFMAFEILSMLDLDAERKAKIISMASRDVSRVAVAQMQDVLWGHVDENVSKDDLFRLYVYKTGRYTFSLPMMMGAALAGADDEALEKLGQIGEGLGIIFQIKDDELGIFSSNDSLGKTVGVDILEEKKTIYYLSLINLLNDKEKSKLAKIVKGKKISKRDLEYVQNLYASYGVKDRLEKENRARADKIAQEIAEIHVNNKNHLDYLYKLLEYNLERKY